MHAARLLLVVFLSAGCAAGVRNYPDPAGPRFAGTHAATRPQDKSRLRVVTFNVKYGRHVDRAIQLFREDPLAASADVVLLQEMDAPGTSAVAEALKLDYVYFPGAYHPKGRADFGNAILSRWPLSEDRKIVLPHRGRFRKLQRVAVGATVQVPGAPVRVYSVHFETPFAVSEGQRRAQIAAVLADAREHARVVIGGDFNSTGVASAALQEGGYTWISKSVGRTLSRFSWDHVFTRGLRPAADRPAVVIRNNRGASDHKPVFAELVLE